MKIEQTVKTILNPISNFKKICSKKNLSDRIKQLAIGVFKLLVWALIAPPLIGGVILIGCYIKENCCKKLQNTENEIHEDKQQDKHPITQDGYGADEPIELSDDQRAVYLFTKFKDLHQPSYGTKSGVFIDIKAEPNKNAVNESKSFLYQITKKNTSQEILIQYVFKNGYNNLSEEGQFFLYDTHHPFAENGFIKLQIADGQYYNVNNFISDAFKKKEIDISPEEVNLNIMDPEN